MAFPDSFLDEIRARVPVSEVAAKEVLEPPRDFEIINERTYGAARVVFLRYG